MNIDVEKMLEEKGIDEAFLINAVESMAMILRGNNYTEQFMPASYNLPEDKSDNGAFAEQVNMMLTDTTLALASIVVGVDALAEFIFKEMQKNDYISLNSEEKDLLLLLGNNELISMIISSTSAVMAALEKRMEEKLSRYEKLDWGVEELNPRIQEIIQQTKDSLEEAVENDSVADIEPLQVKVALMIPAISTMMNIVALIQLSQMMGVSIEFIEEMTGGVSMQAINDVLVNIGASIIEEKLRINFGDDFVKQISAMAEKESAEQLH
ncbi:minor tail protein [Escherichia phage heid]|uniref:Minor tail protein n=1 Tax=Escherichia phage heid TaxID=2696403 RepID=A0A6B9WS40_9CAUD|nr:minor tail protein [Escherichia phage heid]